MNIDDHMFCSRCGNEMHEIIQEDEFELGFDTRTGRPKYVKSYGQWRCSRLDTVQNAYYETGGHDNFTVLSDNRGLAKLQWSAEELAWEIYNGSRP